MLTVGSMFSGIGLLDYGLHLAGLRHVWFAERDGFRRGVLGQRWPGALVLDDVRAVRADAVPRVDVVAGGFPCKGASTAGKRTGLDHPETALWHEMARAVRELRPRYVLVENVANILALHDGAVWGTVVGDLAALGFDIWWDCLPAAAFGAPHLRDRVQPELVAGSDGASVAGWAREVLADAAGERWTARYEPRTDVEHDRLQPALVGEGADRGVGVGWGAYDAAVRRWETVVGPAPEPLVRRVDDGRARRVERSRLSALGDGVQVQAGELCGRWLMNHAAELARAAA